MLKTITVTSNDVEMAVNVEGNHVAISICSDDANMETIELDDNDAIDLARMILTACSYNGRE